MSYRSSKKRTKLEKILRQDHSDVYFDNERLNDELNNKIEFMQKEMLKHDIQRAIEIGKLKKEIHEFKVFRAETRAESRAHELAARPQTVAGSTHKRRRKATSVKRAQSAWTAPAPQSEDNVDHAEVSADEEVTQRAPSVASTASTLRNTKTLRRYKDIGTSCFKENNRFPEEWYVRCLPASDAAIYNARRKTRGKSAPSHFNFLQKIRDKEEIEKRLQSFTTAKRLAQNQQNGGENTAEDKMNLICEEPVKPILMSRRRLKELADANKTVDRAPSRNTVRKQQIDEYCFMERKRMDTKVRGFCDDLKEQKKREIRELKEKEEAKRREIQERKYWRSIELAQLEKSEGHEKSSYEEAEAEFDKWKILSN